MAGTRKLGLNLAWLYGGEAAAKLLGMLAFAWLGRTLGEARYGDLEFAIAVIFILNLVQEAGLGPYGAREAAKRPERTAMLAASVICVRAILVGLALLVLWALSAILDKPAEAEQLILLYGLVLLPAPLVLNWVFQSRDEMGVVAISSLIRQTVLAGGVLLLVSDRGDAWRVPLFDAIGLAAVVGFHLYLFKRRVGRLRLRGALRNAGPVVREASPIALSSLGWALRLFFPVIAMGLWADPASTGIFAAGHRLMVALHTFAWLYFFNLLPSLSRSFHGSEQLRWRQLSETSLRVVGWTAIPACLALACVAPLLLPAIYGTSFTDAAGPFQIQVWLLGIAFVAGHQRYGLIAAGHQGAELRCSLAGAAVSVGGCLALSGGLTPVLAAVVLLVAEATTLVLGDWYLTRRVGRLDLVRCLWKPVLVTGPLAMIGLVLLSDHPWAAVALVLGSAGVGLFLTERKLLAGFLGRHRKRG